MSVLGLRSGTLTGTPFLSLVSPLLPALGMRISSDDGELLGTPERHRCADDRPHSHIGTHFHSAPEEARPLPHSKQAEVVRAELLEHTGRVVSAAALVTVVTFAGFVFGHVADLQEFGVGLALGVHLDATIEYRDQLTTVIANLIAGSW